MDRVTQILDELIIMCKRDPLSQKKQEEAKIKEEEEKDNKEIEECTREI